MAGTLHNALFSCLFKRGGCYAAKREQPQNGYNNDMRNIHSAIIIFMARGRIPLARYNECVTY